MAIDAIKTMQAKDVVSAKLASAFITVDGRRYLLFQAKSLEATLEKEKNEVAILGRMTKGHKTVSMNGTGSLVIYKNTSLFDDMMLKLKSQGVDTYFDLQITNADPTSEAGQQVTILKDCNIDSALIASFDADGEWLEQSIDFTFEDIEIATKFNQLAGME